MDLPHDFLNYSLTQNLSQCNLCKWIMALPLISLITQYTYYTCTIEFIRTQYISMQCITSTICMHIPCNYQSRQLLENMQCLVNKNLHIQQFNELELFFKLEKFSYLSLYVL